MNKKWIAAAVVALPATIGGVVYATAQSGASSDVQSDVQQTSEEGYACPATGELLPCQSCCPLNQE